jgi:hypothetical protein
VIVASAVCPREVSPLNGLSPACTHALTHRSGAVHARVVCRAQTDALIWVVDSADKRRLDACRAELHSLLGQEKLAGASLLIFANKQDLVRA